MKQFYEKNCTVSKPFTYFEFGKYLIKNRDNEMKR